MARRRRHLSAAVENEGRYNDFVPLVYGTAWYRPPIVFARNDGNLTHMEVLLGMGEIEGVTKVLVNDIELPSGDSAEKPTATGWFNIASAGSRNGAFNLDFTDGAGKPTGDPYGSMAVLSVVVPNRISDGRALPKIDVLIRGMKLATYDDSGTFVGEVFTNNPAWVLLDLLRRSGWAKDEIDLDELCPYGVVLRRADRDYGSARESAHGSALSVQSGESGSDEAQRTSFAAFVMHLPCI